MCDDSHSQHVRFAADVLDLQERLSFRRLVRELENSGVPYVAARPDGLVTVAATTEQLPERLLLGIQSFRLEQYLRLGWACREVISSSALFCEPVRHLHGDDIHVATISADTGRILGYVGAVGSRDPEPVDPRTPGRAPFPVEVAHGVNLFDLVPAPAGVTTHQVRELKRFVHDRTLTDRTTRLRTTLELLSGAGEALLVTDPEVRVFVGDVEEQVALHHLLLAGLDVQLIDGTTPGLPDTDLMHLMYVRRAVVKPFVAEAPDRVELRRRIDLLQSVLTSPDVFAALDLVEEHLSGGVRKVAA